MFIQNPLFSQDYMLKKYDALESFLVNIFSQTPEHAMRRIRYFVADTHESYLKEYMRTHRNDNLMDRTWKAVKKHFR